MKRVFFDRFLMLVVFLLMPCAVSAQEDDVMSFSEDEAESDQPASNEEGTMSFDAEESEEDAEEDAQEGEGISASESDILSALGEGPTGTEGEVAVDAKGEKGPQDELKHPIWAVQRIYAIRARRVELQPSFGISMNDPYMHHMAIGLGASYYITEVLAAGLSFNLYRIPGFNAASPLNYRLSRSTHQTVPINEYSWSGQLNFTYVPIYGKFAMFTEWILHWDIWVIGGGGFIFSRPRPTIDPEFRDFDFTMKYCFNVGIGLRLFLSKFLAVFLELRDYIYPEQLESLETSSHEATRNTKSTWLDEDYKLTNNVMLQVGASIFIPFTFDYKLPK